MHEAADFPRRLALAIADPDNRKQLPQTGDRRDGVVRRMGQYDYSDPERDQPRPRKPDDHLGSL
ncbi:MAG: hypothetical protein OXH75_04030 [Acidobacteria bacterium]|nr:hypothetical protein [Acidobacteriota bacterium]